jgi:hypothetical protein
MSKKFNLIKYEVTDGEHSYFDYFLFYTSDVQKMSEMELIAYFYECDKNVKLSLECKDVYWTLDHTRTVEVRGSFPVDLKTAKCLVDLKVITHIPQDQDIIFKKFNNVVQLKKVRKSMR